jgi:hypothetical protein
MVFILSFHPEIYTPPTISRLHRPFDPKDLRESFPSLPIIKDPQSVFGPWPLSEHETFTHPNGALNAKTRNYRMHRLLVLCAGMPDGACRLTANREQFQFQFK